MPVGLLIIRRLFAEYKGMPAADIRETWKKIMKERGSHCMSDKAYPSAWREVYEKLGRYYRFGS